MKVFTRDYRITGEYHPLWDDYFEGMKPCVLDIEATGLDRSRCRVILIGLLVRTDRGVRITQFLAENHYEEAKVLDAAMEFIEEEGIGCLITFNGYAYDIPFINARLDACMDGRHLHMYHFDLYRFLRKSTDIRTRVSSMSQMSLEDHYGIFSDRGDTITGKESVTLFDQYAINGSSTLEKIILTHNREDVLHLHRLMYLALGDIPADPGSATARSIAPDLHTALAAYGFPAGGGRFSIRPAVRCAQGKGRSDILRIAGEQIRDPFSGAWFPDSDQPLTVTFSASSSSYEIEVPVSRRGEDLYIDLSFLLNGTANEDYGGDFSGNSGSDLSGDPGSDLDRSSDHDPYGAANGDYVVDPNNDFDRNLDRDLYGAANGDYVVDPSNDFDRNLDRDSFSGSAGCSDSDFGRSPISDPVGDRQSRAQCIPAISTISSTDELLTDTNTCHATCIAAALDSYPSSTTYAATNTGPDDITTATHTNNAGFFEETLNIVVEDPADCFEDETAANIDSAGLFEDALTKLRNDPDLINGYLILNPRTINLLSKALVLRFCQE